MKQLPIIEQVEEFGTVDFVERDGGRHVRKVFVVQKVEDIGRGKLIQPWAIFEFERPHHCVSFSGASLAVGKHCCLSSLKSGCY